MTNQNAELVTQLDALLRLTADAAATARARFSQATAETINKTLLKNARNSDRRADSPRQAVRDLGGAPDVLGVELGRSAAVAKLPLEQMVPMIEALLGLAVAVHRLGGAAFDEPVALTPTPMQTAATTLSEKAQESTTNAVVRPVGRLVTLAESAKELGKDKRLRCATSASAVGAGGSADGDVLVAEVGDEAQLPPERFDVLPQCPELGGVELTLLEPAHPRLRDLHDLHDLDLGELLGATYLRLVAGDQRHGLPAGRGRTGP